ncbi:hypothetical protein AB0E10_41825 [Streptomyces sp. NPDC048045]|uniref:hypothetical protein n=1 Tax=Streptomyces sp. NPDC048045 TaxID=3154710 RepID=UPI00341DC719
MRSQEGRRTVERGTDFLQDGGEGLEDMRDTGGDVECEGGVIAGCAGREAQGVVEEDLVGAGPDEQRRQGRSDRRGRG